MKVSLTFDNGPHPEVTPQVLGVLRQHGVLANFFVVGNAVQEHGDALPRAAVAAGHRVGNHSFTHSTPLGLVSGSEGVSEVSQTEQLIEALCAGRRMFRPFGGNGALGPHLLSPEVWDYLQRNDYSCVLWNCLAYEWEGADAWVEPTVERCRALEHAVVVLHDLPTGAMAHLDRFIRTLQAHGAEFTQEFPRDCLPLSEGQSAWSAAELQAVIAQA